MATAPYSSDIVLSNTDGSTNKIGLKLYPDTGNVPGGWKVEHLSPAPPRIGTDSANYQQQSPDVGLVLDQDTWHRGFGASFISRFGTATESNRARARYGYTENVLPMFRGELVLGYLTDETDILISNGRFEKLDNNSEYDMSDWETGKSNVTLTSTSTYVNTGDRGAQLASTGAGSYIEQTITWNATFNKELDGSTESRKKVFAHCYLRRISGSGNAKIQIIDSSSTSSSSAITATSAFTFASAEHTVAADATSLKVRILLSADEAVWALDDVAVFPEGGASWTQPQEFEDNIYVACSRGIYKWDDTNEKWNVVYIDPTYDITDLESFGGDLYAGRGSSDNYIYSADGATWTDCGTSGSGNGRYAQFFSKGRNASGDLALFKTRANKVAVATSANDSANFGTEITCGDTDRSITNLFSANDLVYVGREDGLFQYDRGTNKFLDLQPEANLFPDDSNFKSAMGRSGSIFAAGGDQAFFKITFGSYSGSYVFEDLSYLFKAPAYRGFGGRVTAMTQDRNNLFVALADDLESESSGFPYTFPFSFAGANISKSVKLLAVRTQQEEPGTTPEDVAHTIASFTVSSIDSMGKFKGSERMSLFVLGNNVNDDSSDSNNNKEPRAFRLRMPIRNENPSLNSITEHPLSGNFYTPYINFNYPDVNKAAVKLTVNGLNLDSNKYVTVYYKTDDTTDDDTTGWTTWGSDGKFTSSGQTVNAAISTLTSFDRIRFKITFTTNDTGVSPRINALVFHAAWNPIDYRKWTAVVKISDRRSLLLRRVRSTSVKTTDMTTLNNLREQPFVLLQDPDGTSYYVNLRYTDSMISSRVYSTRSVAPDQSRLLTMEMTEVKTS